MQYYLHVKAPFIWRIESQKLVMNLERESEHKLSAMLHHDLTQNRFFMAVKSLALKNEEMQIMCVGEGYFVADVKDFSLIYTLENVHIISRFCCFSDFSHHWKTSFLQAVEKLFQI